MRQGRYTFYFLKTEVFNKEMFTFSVHISIYKMSFGFLIFKLNNLNFSLQSFNMLWILNYVCMLLFR